MFFIMDTGVYHKCQNAIFRNLFLINNITEPPLFRLEKIWRRVPQCGKGRIRLSGLAYCYFTRVGAERGSPCVG